MRCACLITGKEAFGVFLSFAMELWRPPDYIRQRGSSQGMTLHVSFRKNVSKAVFIFVVTPSSRDPLVLALGEVFVKQI